MPSQRTGNARIAAVTTTSGGLRDANTGAPIRNSCVAWRSRSRSVTFPGSQGTTRVDDRGSWSFKSEDPGPFFVAFYVTDGDCSQGAVLTGSENYRAAWYRGHPFIGTNPNADPPAEADPVAAGSSDIIACLAKQNVLATECATPNTTVSGRVVSFGPRPVLQACIAALGADSNDLGVTMSDADGRWTLTGLPINYDFVVLVLPRFRSSRGPCDSDGPPPVPPPGGLQPEF
jgi:hypothetical protein